MDEAMRVKLINRFRLQLAQLNTVATDTAGYDHEFREPVQVADSTQVGTDARSETTLTVLAQIEPGSFDALRMRPSGNSKQSAFVAIVHFSELERRSLLDANGLAKIRVGDRLDAIYTARAVPRLVMTVPALPGLYCVEARPIEFGISEQLNLLQLVFRSRDQAG